MKRILPMLAGALLLLSGNAQAVFVSGSTGALGAFNPTANTTVTLPADGILNYTTVNIPSTVTVTFARNSSNAPVQILATGDVTIAGILKVNGGSYSTTTSTPGAGGPGGFDGGYGGATSQPGGKGQGPGGGAGGPSSTFSYGGGGGFATVGGTHGANFGAGGAAYGNSMLLPLIGGSGGGGAAGTVTSWNYGGGGGGGALLIASSTSITVTGTINANGGDGYANYSAGGSGGAVRLIANALAGTGAISAKGGSLTYNNRGGQGRIRLEAYTNNFTLGTDPVYTFGLPGVVFVANQPVLRITSVAGTAVPASPSGSYAQPDILLPSTTANPVTVALSASNIPVTTTVTVSATPLLGSPTSVSTTLSGTDASSTGSASVNLPSGAVVVTAQATFTLQTALYLDGEKIDKVRVASTMGRESEAVYISESGREIKASELMARLTQ